MKKIIFLAGIILSLAHLQLEVSTWYYNFFGTKQIYPLFDFNNSPDWYKKEGISIEWWLKMVTDDIFAIATYSVMAFAFKSFSRRLYLISLLFVAYHVFSHIMLWINFGTSEWTYLVVLIDCIVSVFILIFVKDKKQAVVKSLI